MTLVFPSTIYLMQPLQFVQEVQAVTDVIVESELNPLNEKGCRLQSQQIKFLAGQIFYQIAIMRLNGTSPTAIAEKAKTAMTEIFSKGKEFVLGHERFLKRQEEVSTQLDQTQRNVESAKLSFSESSIPSRMEKYRKVKEETIPNQPEKSPVETKTRRAPLSFPDENKMKECVREHPLLKSNYYEEKGITQAIAELAATRFANSKEMEFEGVQLGIALMLYDLQTGVDGFTGQPLPNLGKILDNNLRWPLIAIITEKAIVDCASKK